MDAKKKPQRVDIILVRETWLISAQLICNHFVKMFRKYRTLRGKESYLRPNE